MNEYYIDEQTGKRRVLLTPAIAKGAAGTIHRVINEPGIVAKLYIDPKDCIEYRDKVAAMISAPPRLPPIEENGREYVQIAWPTAAVTGTRGGVRGFIMPEVDLSSATELENVLQKSMRRRKNLPEFYGGRVLLAANMASLLAELHAIGHYMVDMKPANMRFYPHIWYMAILDTDGFSINGARRFSARQFSDDYIAPEAKGKRPEQLGLEQDLFSLAVIIFQLLNNGIHPFQGVDRKSSGSPNTRQERIFAGLYAYGRAPNPAIGPTAASIHDYLEPKTRELFDHAFLDPKNRPTAEEWRSHLVDLVTNKKLVRCSANPRDHGHFSRGCGLCALERRMAAPQVSSAVLTAVPVARLSPRRGRMIAAPVAGSYPSAPVYGGVPPTVLAPSPPPVYRGAKGLILALGALFAVAIFVALFSSGSKDAAPKPQTQIPPVSSPTFAPSPRPEPRQTIGIQQPPPSTAPQPPAWSPPPPARTATPRCVSFNNRMICE
jgi:DNA-binding helix-hairpin-helix protein with protein kinase domain